MRKRWFTETRYVDIDTGEELSKSQVKREHWIRKGGSDTIEDKGTYYLKIYTKHYERNRQQRLFE